MAIKKLTCIICPRGCSISIDTISKEANGNSCIRGARYALEEITNPTRILTTIVRVHNRNNTMASVKTSSRIPINKINDVLKEIKKLNVSAPCKFGAVLVKNILSLGVDVILTKNIQ